MPSILMALKEYVFMHIVAPKAVGPQACRQASASGDLYNKQL